MSTPERRCIGELERLVRAAVMSREPRRLRQAWEMLNARAELARAMRWVGGDAPARHF